MNVTSGDYDPRFYWARANGWTLMAMAELLAVLPENYEGRDEVLHLYLSMIRSLASLQDDTYSIVHHATGGYRKPGFGLVDIVNG